MLMILFIAGSFAVIATCALAANWCADHVDNRDLPKWFVEFFDMQEEEQ